MTPPKFIYLVRHGQSEANENIDILKTVPDWKVPLTEKGRQQAFWAGTYIAEDLEKKFGNCCDILKASVYCSPYKRAIETCDCVNASLFEKLSGNNLDRKKNFVYLPPRVKYDPRLREQDWGNYKDSETSKRIDSERDEYGTFFYRIPDGESGADVYDRLSTFLDTLWRDFSKTSVEPVCIIVTHGLTMRLFLMRWFHWNIEYYENLKNPKNGEVWRMSRDEENKWYLDTPLSYKFA